LLETLVGISIQEDKKPDWIKPLHHGRDGPPGGQGGGGGDAAVGEHMHVSDADAAGGPSSPEAVARKPPSSAYRVEKAFLPSSRVGLPQAGGARRVSLKDGPAAAAAALSSSSPETKDEEDHKEAPHHGSAAVGSAAVGSAALAPSSAPRDGFMWLDPSENREESSRAATAASTASGSTAGTATGSTSERPPSPDFELEASDDGAEGGVESDPRKSAAINDWNDSWAGGGGGGRGGSGKHKRPLRRGEILPGGAYAKSVQWPEAKSGDGVTTSPPPGSVPPGSKAGSKAGPKSMHKLVVERVPSLPAPLDSRGLAGVYAGGLPAPASASAPAPAPSRSGGAYGSIEGIALLLLLCFCMSSTFLFDILVMTMTSEYQHAHPFFRINITCIYIYMT
jgi:hypothetical protein